MSRKNWDDLFVNLLDISSISSGTMYSSSEKCISEISASSVVSENLINNNNSKLFKNDNETKCSKLYGKENMKEVTNSDIEYEITEKYVKSILKNKEKQKFYEFRKYLSDTDVFFAFVEIFLYLIKNKEKVINPYDYIIKYFKLKTDDCDIEKKKILIEENNFYKKENEKLNNKINLLEFEINDIQKRNCCNAITKFFFKNDYEQLNAYEIFNKFIKNREKLRIEPSFIFTKDTFSLFLNFLSDYNRTKLYDILMQKTFEQNYSFFSDKLPKKLTKFINYYLSFDKFAMNEDLEP